MKIKYQLFTLLVFISFAKSNAQIAGYMGKRLTLEYANYFSPSLSPTAITYDAPGLNSVHCLNIDYTIKQRTNFCVTGQYLHTGIPASSEYHGMYPQINYVGNYDKGISFQSINIGLGFKFFRQGSIAPLGKYSKLEFLFFIETVSFDSKDFRQVREVNGYNVIEPYGGPTTFNYSNVALTFTLGKQRVFANCIVFDYGIRFGVAPAFILNNMFFDVNRSLEEQYKSDSQLRILGGQFINVHVGIGFLAF